MEVRTEVLDEALRGLFAAALDALLAIDADGTIVYLHDQAELLVGRSDRTGWPSPIDAGLDLNTVCGIIRQNGAEVTIDSTVQEDTTVTVVLRRRSSRSPRPCDRRTVADRGQERICFSPPTALEVREVFDLEGGSPDMVVTDIVTIQTANYELARPLRERKPDHHVIFVAGYDFSTSPLTGRLLTQPVDVDLLLHAVQEVLDGQL